LPSTAAPGTRLDGAWNGQRVVLGTEERLLTRAFSQEVFTELLGELCDLAVPAPLELPADSPQVDLRRHVGVYERVGMRMEASLRDGRLVLQVTPTGAMAELHPPSTWRWSR
jgi:hypothetical protein